MMAQQPDFASRLIEQTRARGNPLCAGIHSIMTMTFFRRRYVFMDQDLLKWLAETRQ